jgi:hypothetical protein
VERKGTDNPYAALNGNMFTLLHGPAGRLAIRLTEDEREKFLRKYKTKLFEAYEAVMRVCCRSRCNAEEAEGAATVFRDELRVCQHAGGEADPEESVSRA